jgi:hypothetical protein
MPAPKHTEIASRVSTYSEPVTRELNRLSKIDLVRQATHLKAQSAAARQTFLGTQAASHRAVLELPIT